MLLANAPCILLSRSMLEKVALPMTCSVFVFSFFAYIFYVQPFCYPDNAVRREVKKLIVICANKKFGCDFIGELDKYFKVRRKPSVYLHSVDMI